MSWITVMQRIEDMDKIVKNKITPLLDRRAYFSIDFDEFTDEADVSQVCNFARIIDNYCNMWKELLGCVSMLYTQIVHILDTVKFTTYKWTTFPNF